MLTSVSLSHIQYEPGLQKPIKELDFLAGDPERLETYQHAGFRNFFETKLSMRELSRRSAEKTLQDSGIAREDIGACLYVAESFDRAEIVNPREIHYLLADLGIPQAYPIHLSASNCANVLVALRVASAMIRAGEARYLLLISADKPSRRPQGRKMYNEMSFKSDLALSCLVRPAGEGEYDLEYVGQENTPDQIRILDDLDSVPYAMTKFKKIRRIARKALKTLGKGPGDYKSILTNNYGLEVTKTLVELCGFETKAGFYENIPRFGHASAGDNLVNLKDLADQQQLAFGDRLFLLSDSITSCSVASLRKT